jgi:hypothetical protein
MNKFEGLNKIQGFKAMTFLNNYTLTCKATRKKERNLTNKM